MQEPVVKIPATLGSIYENLIGRLVPCISTHRSSSQNTQSDCLKCLIIESNNKLISNFHCLLFVSITIHCLLTLPTKTTNVWSFWLPIIKIFNDASFLKIHGVKTQLWSSFLPIFHPFINHSGSSGCSLMISCRDSMSVCLPLLQMVAEGSFESVCQ